LSLSEQQQKSRKGERARQGGYDNSLEHFSVASAFAGGDLPEQAMMFYYIVVLNGFFIRPLVLSFLYIHIKFLLDTDPMVVYSTA